LPKRAFIIIYADDKLLIAPSVTELEKLVRMCEMELQDLETVINPEKSYCIHKVPVVISYATIDL